MLYELILINEIEQRAKIIFLSVCILLAPFILLRNPNPTSYRNNNEMRNKNGRVTSHMYILGKGQK